MKLDVRVKKNLRDFLLDVEFCVHDEIFALLGASGSGKSMTLKCIAGIETPDEGRIVLDGRILFDSEHSINLSPQLRRVGYLFQNYALFPNMTVAENILFAAVGSRDEKLSRLRENLSRFKLDGLENVFPDKLSGGQAQRVAFARVLASHAQFLLLDEPLSALDNFLRRRLELELAEVFKSYGAAILVSHDGGEVFRLADRIAVIDAGKVEAVGSAREIFTHPPTLTAAKLTGCRNISAAKKIADDKLFADDWGLTLIAKKIPDDLKFVGIRADSLSTDAGENFFTFEVAAVVEDIDAFDVIVRREGKSLVWRVDEKQCVMRNAKCAINVGDEINLSLPTDKIFLFG
ncbi:MAG: ATP-binding cassette domain-containing protein [Selenomonadaceae bacterium]|nr:ATP-binding cassette domain-containing protein [Selenomonadaceae bacterium]